MLFFSIDFKACKNIFNGKIESSLFKIANYLNKMLSKISASPRISYRRNVTTQESFLTSEIWVWPVIFRLGNFYGCKNCSAHSSSKTAYRRCVRRWCTFYFSENEFNFPEFEFIQACEISSIQHSIVVARVRGQSFITFAFRSQLSVTYSACDASLKMF